MIIGTYERNGYFFSVVFLCNFFHKLFYSLLIKIRRLLKLIAIRKS